jgi:hypothetical protein
VVYSTRELLNEGDHTTPHQRRESQSTVNSIDLDVHRPARENAHTQCQCLHCISCNDNPRPSRSPARASAEVMDRWIEVPVPSVSVKSDGPPSQSDGGSWQSRSCPGRRCCGLRCDPNVATRHPLPTQLTRGAGRHILPLWGESDLHSIGWVPPRAAIQIDAEAHQDEAVLRVATLMGSDGPSH